LKIEVPGIDEKDIDVRIENNTLTVHGERKFEKEEKEENYRRVERQYGSFTRTFTLPNTVDQESVQADYDKGVLKIKLAKKAEAKPKQIKVNVGSAGEDAGIRWDKFTVKAQEAKRANELASRTAIRNWRRGICLAVSFEDKEGIVAPVLEKIGIGPQAVLSDVYKEIEKLPKVSLGQIHRRAGSASARTSSPPSTAIRMSLAEDKEGIVNRHWAAGRAGPLQKRSCRKFKQMSSQPRSLSRKPTPSKTNTSRPSTCCWR
jgi:hypothetical protein